MDLQALLARARDVRLSRITADGVSVVVREPTMAANSEYAETWRAGKRDEALAGLLRHCVVDDKGAPCLDAEQALQLARAGAELTRPIIEAINGFTRTQKKPDAPGADAVQDQPASGAPAV